MGLGGERLAFTPGLCEQYNENCAPGQVRRRAWLCDGHDLADETRYDAAKGQSKGNRIINTTKTTTVSGSPRRRKSLKR